MFFASSKCPLPALVAWCRTLKHSLGAGLDPIKIFKQLAKSGPQTLRSVAKDIATRLGKGESLQDAFDPYRDRFPPLFVEMIAVGEQTGRLEETFRELEDYYETSYRVQSDFRAHMTYPAIQFIAAVFIISGLLFVLGMLGSKVDPLGLGLTGTSGALVFMLVCFGIVGAALAAFKIVANNVRWRARLEGLALMLPAWGPALMSFALQRFCVAMRMTHEAGLKTERVVHYSFRATANSTFLRGETRAAAVAKKGGELHEAMVASGAPFPSVLCESIEVAEMTGQVSEVAERMSEQYREEAARRMKQAAQFTSWAIYAIMAILIIIAIFSIAMNVYINPLREATRDY